MVAVVAVVDVVAEEHPRLIRGEAHTTPFEWQQWLDALPCPELEMVDTLGPRQLLVVVAPHPDDEVLACGGLIALHAARGSDVVVVAVTEGEGSHAGVLSPLPGELAALRRAERLRGLVSLGMAQPEVRALNLPDGEVQAHSASLRDGLRALLRPGDVVVSTWEFDGHPDHDATGLASRQACLHTGARFLASPVWMWHWAAPADPRVPWHRLRRWPLSRPMWDAKQAAVAAHATQLTPRSAKLGAVLGTAVLARAAWPHEYFFV